MSDPRQELVFAGGCLAREILDEPGGEHLYRCMSCGTCSSGCPVRESVPEFDPRAIVRLVLLGAEEVFDGQLLWLCAGCATCEERCPAGVHLPALITAIRNVGVRRGKVPAALVAQVALLREHGRLLEVEEHNKRRAKVGLPPLSNQPADYAKILDAAGLRAEASADGGEEAE